MSIEIFNRQEVKFLIDAAQLSEIAQAIEQYVVLDEHNKDSATYTLYNLYIDTTDSELIRHSLSGPTYKEKIRIRSYETFTDDGLVFLEVKKRFKKITNKRRTKMTYAAALKFVETGEVDLMPYMNLQVVYELQAMLRSRNYFPKTLITYNRLAYFAKNPATDLRITFDSHITSQRFGSSGQSALLADDRIIMEIKSMYNMPLWLVDILSTAGVHKQGFSKYGQEYLQHLRTARVAALETYNA